MRPYKFDLEDFLKAAQEAGGIVSSGSGELIVGGVKKSFSESIETVLPSNEHLESYITSSKTATYKDNRINEEYPNLAEMILAA